MSTETSTISIFPESHFSKTNNQFGETLFFFGKWQLFVLVSLRSASPTKCQAISRVFVSRTLLARTCLSVTSHFVQVVGVPRSLFSWCPERDSKRLSCMFCAHRLSRLNPSQTACENACVFTFGSTIELSSTSLHRGLSHEMVGIQEITSGTELPRLSVSILSCT